MRITWLFGSAVVVAAGFGLGLLLVPGALLEIYGIALDTDGNTVARILGAQILGIMVLEWAALRGERKVREANLRSVIVADVLGFLVTVIAAINGVGNVLIWSIAGLFLVYTLWRGYYLWFNRDAIGSREAVGAVL